MVSFNDALEQIKGDLATAIPAGLIDRLCAALAITGRRRVFTPVVTTFLALTRALHGASLTALRRVSGFDVSPQAYCQALARLPVAFFERLQQAVTDGGPAPPSDRGRRLFLIDGSGVSMPDTPGLQAAFGQPSGQAPGCGFPVAHLLIQFAAATGYAVRTVVAPFRTGDLTHAALTHDALAPGDVLVGDRAFGSYAHLAVLRGQGRHGVFRMHQRRHGARATRPRDRVVAYQKPPARPRWLSAADYAALPAEMPVREVRVAVTTPGGRVRRLVLVTTLLDARADPPAAIAAIYAARWRAETNLRHLKQTLGLDVLRSRTADGVRKEVHCLVTVYNLVCRVMVEAARRQNVRPTRVSFIDALRWLRRARPGDRLPALVVNPDRPGRFEPRVRKRRPRNTPVMVRPRTQLKQELLSQAKHALS